jgi:7-cyano-7-deazaguanine synthase
LPGLASSGRTNTFVPGRNLLFLTLACRRGLRVLMTGVCVTDCSGHPDCRDDTMKAMRLALSLGMDKRFLIETPLMQSDKVDTWRLAPGSRAGRAVGAVDRQNHGLRKLPHQQCRGWPLQLHVLGNDWVDS